jgi:hypothetical protein
VAAACDRDSGQVHRVDGIPAPQVPSAVLIHS